MPTIALTNMVKNEAKVIRRCLDSVRPLVDFILVQDTGSADGTQDIIRTWLSEYNIPGKVWDWPWRGFAENRTAALEALRDWYPQIDYGIMLDADDTLIVPPTFNVAAWKAGLTADIYDLKQFTPDGTFLCTRQMIWRNSYPFTYQGHVHDTLTWKPGDNLTRELVDGMRYIWGSDGSRHDNNAHLAADMEVMERALREGTTPEEAARTVFHLATYYNTLGSLKRALELFEQRVNMGHSQEERYISLCECGRLMQDLGYSDDAVLNAYVHAHALLPIRAEAAHCAAVFCHAKGRFAEGFNWATVAVKVRYPGPALFSKTWIYVFGALEEYMRLAFLNKRFDLCVQAAKILIENPNVPDIPKRHAHHHLKMCRKKLGLPQAVQTRPTNTKT
jgi:glycosyltransferase involved in cell wall biosynthesis